MALDRSPEEVGETQSSGPNPSSDAEPVAKENAATSSDQVSAEPSQASLEAPTVAQLPVLFDEHESYRGTMHKFSVYETTARFYIVGGDLTDNRFRVLKIDRTTDYGDLSLAEDGVIYTKREVNRLIATIDEGNKSAGGLKLRCSTWGILGFIRFTGAYYMLLITKRSQVAVIGGHFIYKIDGTELIPVAASSSRFKSDRYAEEARFLGIFNNLDLSRSFYFCYSYDLTRTLQFNLLRAREAVLTGSLNISSKELNVIFLKRGANDRV
ncbi:MAG: phosphatidylinositol-3,5-bisphosphate 5-phosphatase [Phylliscum demangeonii]|nr:MAG: phosphatidylinositol-3,5-bisphosphate 5-phosphatase [Phylliscum demangeonii]